MKINQEEDKMRLRITKLLFAVPNNKINKCYCEKNKINKCYCERLYLMTIETEDKHIFLGLLVFAIG